MLALVSFPSLLSLRSRLFSHFRNFLKVKKISLVRFRDKPKKPTNIPYLLSYNYITIPHLTNTFKIWDNTWTMSLGEIPNLTSDTENKPLVGISDLGLYSVYKQGAVERGTTLEVIGSEIPRDKDGKGAAVVL